MRKSILDETEFSSNYILLESSAEKPLPSGVIGELIFESPIQMGDKLNKNGRCYPWNVLKEANSKLLESAVKESKAVSFDGHPRDPLDMKPSAVNAKLVDFEIDESTATIKNAKFHIVDTRVGQDALALARAKIPLGTSSRASGSFTENGSYKGRFGEVKGTIVSQDLEIKGYDLVMDPSVVTARSSHLREEIENPLTGDDAVEIKSLAEFREKYPQVADVVLKEFAAESEEQFNTLLEQYEQPIRQEIAAEYDAKKEEAIKEAVEKALEDQKILHEQSLERMKRDNEKEIGRVKTLNESISHNEQELRSQLDETQRTLSSVNETVKSLQESVGNVKKTADQEQAKAYVLEATDGNPFADVLRVSVLGPKMVTVGKDLAKQYVNVVPPANLEEAKIRLNQAKTFAESLKINTEVGSSNVKPEPELTESQQKTANRLKVLIGDKK
jgi:hypothetical protein